jgi:transposase-like protein
MTTAKKRTTNGPQPDEKLVRSMERRGYALVATLAADYDVAPTTIYDWVRSNRLRSPVKKPVSFRYRGNVWVLRVAVLGKVKLPAGVAS